MADELIPLDVRDFIVRHIDSVTHLEALLLLLNQPDARWSVGSAAAQLYIETDQAALVLQRLCEDGLARCTDEVYWFNTDAPGQREIVERLAELYSSHLIPVTNLIHAKPLSARAFAAAFKLRKDK